MSRARGSNYHLGSLPRADALTPSEAKGKGQRGGPPPNTTIAARPRATATIRRRLGAFLFVALAATACAPAAHSSYVARDSMLRRAPLYLYPSRDTARPPRALVFFFGNDVGFWKAHQELAEHLAADGYAVAGFDVKRWIGSLPDGRQHDSAFAAGVDTILGHARHELQCDSAPVIIGGHSIGAEFALWTAAHAAPPGTIGVLAMGPGSRSHLEITAFDLTNAREPDGPDSFGIPDVVRAVPSGMRIALVRGQKDKFRFVDSSLTAAGGPRLHEWLVLFSGHSLKSLFLTHHDVDAAMDWLVAPRSPRLASR